MSQSGYTNILELPALGASTRHARAGARGAIRHRRLGWWLLVAAILVASLAFQSRTDPSTRFAESSGSAVGKASWYQQQAFGGLTPSDLVVLSFGLAAGAARVASRRLVFSRRAALVTAAISAVIAIGVAVGVLHGAREVFGDWRNLMMGAVFAFALWSTVLRDDEGSYRFAQVFVAVTAGYGAIKLFEYAGGGGAVAFYGRTTVANHADLEFVAASVGIALGMLRSRRSMWLWWSGAVIGTLTILLSFRRYSWLELVVIGVVFLVVSGREQRKRYLAAIAAVIAVCAVGVALTWSQLAWSERFATLDPRTTSSENALAATNEGHLDDIRDGLDQVNAHPILGLGVGVSWVGDRTVAWKQETSSVHNGPVLVWIKFGLLGLIAYLTLYTLLFRELWRRRAGIRASDMVALGGGAWLFANFVSSTTVYAWIMSVPEQGLLFFAVLAAAFPAYRASMTDQRDPGE